MRAIRKTHRQKVQLEDPYIATTQPKPRGTRHTVMPKLIFFRTIPGTPDQLANTAVPWKLTPVDQHTFRTISANVQLWTVTTTTTEKQVPPNPEPRLNSSQTSSAEEHNPKRNETKTIDPEHHHRNNSDEYDSPSDDDDLHFKAQMRHPPEIGESNAESTERTKRIEDEVAQMKKQRHLRRETRRRNPYTSNKDNASRST